MAEFALILPALLLLLLVAIDFGRVYLGYVNLQQMVRVAGGYASLHAHAWDTPQDAAVIADYNDLIANDAQQINCELPSDGSSTLTTFPSGFDLGDPVDISISCNFHVLTPIISQILGGVIPVSASTTYPIREGAVAEVPGGGGPIITPPTAEFMGLPQSGYGKTATDYGTLAVTFTDLSKNAPTTWEWNFGDGNGLVFGKGPHIVDYKCDKAAEETCTFTVTLTVSNSGGTDAETKTDYITVTVPPDTGPVAEFNANPQTGTAPLNVAFNFVDVRAGSVTYSGYDWTFGDGAVGTGATTSHIYAASGAYDVTLKVTEAGTGATNSQTKTAYVVASKKICIVPDFGNRKKNQAQGLWSAAGFTTNVQFLAGNGNYTIHTQTITGGTVDPQPDGCASKITVGP